MNYQGYLIGNFGTGLDRERQPWLLPDDAQFLLYDGFVYRGVWQKREGYSQFATGQKGGTPYCESRMIHSVTVAANEVPDGIIKTFTFNVAGTTKPLRRGGFKAVNTSSGVVVQTIQDDGLGGTAVSSDGNINSVINYTTTLATPQSVTFTNPPGIGDTVSLTLDVHQGLPVMGVMNFYTQQNTRELIVADTTYVNRYNITTNRLDDITPSSPLSGDKTSFMSWTNYPDPLNLQRLLFVNFTNKIQQYNGTSVTPYPVYTASTQVTNTPSGVLGDGTVGPYTFSTPADTGIVPGTLSVIDVIGAQTITFDQFGVASGAGTGTVNFQTGAISVTFTLAVGVGNAINITYKQLNTPIQTALHIYQFKDRLVVAYTVESSVNYGLRLRISGTGAMGDVFTSDAIGAGVIDIPTNTFLSAGDFNRDDLILFVKQETWIMKYTGNDVVPFALDRIDGTRGSEAPYGTITYLNRTNALSPLGLILTDGYTVERADDKIPDFSYNEVDSDNFNLCFAGSVDKDRDHYLLYPSMDQEKSDRILVTNYEEDNYSIYRIPLSSMGNFIVPSDITWDDFNIGGDPNNPLYPTWDALASVYGNWNAFAFSKGAPLSIGGGHEGQIVRLVDIETEDYPVLIRNITVIDSQTLQVTTDFQNYALGDFIALEAISGMVEANNKQYQLIDVVSPYIFKLLVKGGVDATTFSAYTGNGVASKCIEFDCKTKKFNPFANANKKVACGWLYFYVSTTGTDLTVNSNITNAYRTNPCQLEVPGHGYDTGTQVYVNGVQGMTQLNGQYYYCTVIDRNNITLNGVDATGFTDYSGAGFTSIPQDAILDIRCITNDTEESTQVYPYNPSPYQVNMTSQQSGNGIKKWYKLWINQTARFIQLEVKNNQSGAEVQIHAIMPGFAPTGVLI